MQIVERFEDMSPQGKLKLIRQDDGDVIVVIIPDPDADETLSDRQVEFCTYGGGGQSQRTLKALWDLMDAMEEDNRLAIQYREA